MMLLMGGVAAAAAGFLSSRGGRQREEPAQVKAASSRTNAPSGEAAAAAAAATTLYKEDAMPKEEEVADVENEPAEKVDADTMEDDEEDDPYANLPEEDEDTDCTMCQTFRQGPCRPFWRKLERCFKDNESSSDGGDDNNSAASKCVRYFTPHQNCLSNYTNLYQLISLDLKQELVNDVVEPAVSPGERRPFHASDVVVDWTRWRQFYAEMGPSFRQTVNHHRTTEPATTPLWKRLPSPSTSSSSAGNEPAAAMVEPVLILTKATLPVRPPTVDAKKNAADSSNLHDNMLLKIAYAIDQDGFVIGLSYNSHYGELMEQAKKLQQRPNNEDGGSVDKADNDNQSAKEETAAAAAAANNDKTKSPADPSSSTDTKTTYDLDFYILPGECRTVRICALYAEDPLTVADSDKEILDVLLYKSKFLNLEEQINIAAQDEAQSQPGP